VRRFGLILLVFFLFQTKAFGEEVSWKGYVQLTDDDFDSKTSDNNMRCITPDDSCKLHVVWSDNCTTSTKDIHYRHGRYLDEWGDPITYAYWDGHSFEHPGVVVGDSLGDDIFRIHVAWLEDKTAHKAYYKRKDLPTGKIFGDGGSTCVAFDDPFRVHMVHTALLFNQPPYPDSVVFYWRSIDGGKTWEGPDTLSQIIDTLSNVLFSKQPSVAVDDLNRVYVVWWNERVRDTSPTGNDTVICHRRSINGGAGWEVKVDTLSYTPSENIIRATHPSVAADNSGRVHVVWNDRTENPTKEEIYYRLSTNGGVGWEDTTNLSQNPDYKSHRPSVAVDGSGGIHVVWWNEDEVDPLRDSEIYYNRDEQDLPIYRVLPPEGTLSYTTTLMNNSAQKKTVRFWRESDIDLPPDTVTLAGHTTLLVPREVVIPSGAPLGQHHLQEKVREYYLLPPPVIDRDHFFFRVESQE